MFPSVSVMTQNRMGKRPISIVVLRSIINKTDVSVPVGPAVTVGGAERDGDDEGVDVVGLDVGYGVTTGGSGTSAIGNRSLSDTTKS